MASGPRLRAPKKLKRSSRRGTPADLLVVGLGNPGSKYSHTRHNVGADVVRRFVDTHDEALRSVRRLKAQHTTVRLPAPQPAESGDILRVDCAVPEVFMNESGQAVRLLLRRAGISDAAALVVVHDELDLPPGALRVKAGGGFAGHNGLASIRQHTGAADFTRVRIGVGKPPAGSAGVSYVLSRPSRAERAALDAALEVAVEAINSIATAGVEATMNAFNGRRPLAPGDG